MIPASLHPFALLSALTLGAIYVIGGTGEETYTPSFVCRGFRYVQISGVDEPIPAKDISGLVIPKSYTY